MKIRANLELGKDGQILGLAIGIAGVGRNDREFALLGFHFVDSVRSIRGNGTQCADLNQGCFNHSKKWKQPLNTAWNARAWRGNRTRVAPQLNCCGQMKIGQKAR